MRKHSSFLILLLLFFTGCKDYYNDMVDWCGEIPIGTELDSVKLLQPKYLTIDWESPEKRDSFELYQITFIKGNRDILNMQNVLAFVENKYRGRWASK